MLPLPGAILLSSPFPLDPCRTQRVLYASSSSLCPRLAPGSRASPGGLSLLEALLPPQPRGLSPTRSSGVLSSTSTSLSSRVRAVKMKSSSTHSTYLVVTWDMARFRPANQPWEKGMYDW